MYVAPIYSMLPRVRCFWAIDYSVPQHASSPSDENNITYTKAYCCRPDTHPIGFERG